jgi:hypothetical protein
MQLTLHFSEANRPSALCMLLGKFRFSPLTVFTLPVSPLHREFDNVQQADILFIFITYSSVLNIYNSAEIMPYLTNSHFFIIY